MFIYVITNSVNAKLYVGCTIDAERRWNEHVKESLENRGFYLHRAMRKYGVDKFEMILVERCGSIVLMKKREKFWIAALKTNERDSGYNLTSGGDGTLGLKHSDDAKSRRIFSDDEIKEIISLHRNQGFSMFDLRKKYKTGESTLYRLFEQHGITPVVRGKAVDDATIVAEYLGGDNITTIKERYTISPMRISHILEKHGVKRTHAEAKRIYQCNETFFDEINTEEKAYILGVMFAYRCNKIVSDGGKVIEITTTDLPIIRRVTRALDASHPIRKRPMYDRSETPLYQLQIRSVKLFNTLAHNGCKNEGDLSFPNIPLNLLNHFIRGHFDGTGSTYWGNGYLFFRVTESRRFLEDWVDKMEPVLKKCIIKDSNISSYILCSSDKKSKTFRDWLYEESTIWSLRKKEIFFKDNKKAD